MSIGARALLATALLLSGCTGIASIGPSQAAVARFHELLDAGSFDQIWDEADDSLRKAATKERFNQLVEAIHRKLGKVVSVKERNWNVRQNVGTGDFTGDFVQIVEDTTFENGTGTEDFVWRIVAGKPRLAGYHINSQDLITR